MNVELFRASRPVTCRVCVLLAACVAWSAVVARNQGQDAGSKNKADEVRLPDDPRLLELHKEFVTKAEKLARDYEKDKDLDKARICYQEILRVVPGYPKAEAALAKIRTDEATADRKVLDVMANKDWQDAGIELIEGKPVVIRAMGTWHFKMIHELSPEGIPIPEELRQFNLGSLVGIVVEGDPRDAKPFLVGAGTEFVSEVSGRLFLRMYDTDVTDNSGKLKVEITGTFDN